MVARFTRGSPFWIFCMAGLSVELVDDIRSHDLEIDLAGKPARFRP